MKQTLPFQLRIEAQQELLTKLEDAVKHLEFENTVYNTTWHMNYVFREKTILKVTSSSNATAFNSLIIDRFENSCKMKFKDTYTDKVNQLVTYTFEK